MIDSQEIFTTLEHLYSSALPLRERYASISSAFNRMADIFTRDAGICFTGLLPRVDYLIKKYLSAETAVRKKAGRFLSIRVHDLRYRLSIIDTLSDEELINTLPHDIATLARWTAVLTGTCIPATLLDKFPITNPDTGQYRTFKPCMRIIVDRIDSKFIYSRATDNAMKEIRTGYTGLPYDFGYLQRIVTPGTQLNVINGRFDNENTLIPELIIFEPDYLIDISEIAECFETYATSPAVSMIKKIRPEQISKSILLGVFAGQLLDEAIHRKDNVEFDYKTAITEFFKNSALKMAVCPDLDSSFHSEAKCQQLNIEKAIRKTLHEIKGYDSEKIVVEPSFFCETLGIQGRMDMLQTDFTILIEQKSGKGQFGSDEHGAPVHRESHLVQLLLYQAILHYGMNMPSSAINSFLLYSKYPRPLLKPGNAPKLLGKAIEIRNLIVAQEIKLAEADGFSLLDTMSPEKLNENGVAGKLWEQYIKPQLTSILSPYSCADELKKAYVKRLLQFVAAEQMCAKTGFNAVTSSTGFSGAWLTPLSEKKNTGNIYDNLTVHHLENDENGNVKRVTVRISDDNTIELANFRTGDIVILYSYPTDALPDMRRSIAIRASIEKFNNSFITLLLRSPQSNPELFTGECLWAIEHDLLDSSFRGLYRSVYSFLSAPDRRADLILNRRKPTVSPQCRLNGEYGVFNDMVARSKCAGDIFAIIGPPGTGKTSFGMLNILQEELTTPGSAIIVTAYTNRAVDEICNRLVENGIDFMRIGTSLGCNPEYRRYLQSSKVEKCHTVTEVRQLLKSTRVITGTIQAIATSSSIFSFRKFNLAIVDEASQILEPHMLNILCAATPDNTSAIERFVLIGDHKQLPAVVQQPVEKSAVTNPQLREMGLTDCRRSFFERFLEMAFSTDTGTYNPGLVYEFSRQGRMHADISSVASHMFYGGKLDIIPLPHQTEPIRQCTPLTAFGEILNHKRLAFIDIIPPEESMRGNANRYEADAIAEIVKEIFHRQKTDFNPERTVGVIVPYRNQISTVRAAISRIGAVQLDNISVDTVERYQGSQRDYIIYGFTATQSHQLAFLTSSRFVENGILIDRKLNVALTRARSHMIIVGNSRLLVNDPIYAKVIKFSSEPPCLS